MTAETNGGVRYTTKEAFEKLNTRLDELDTNLDTRFDTMDKRLELVEKYVIETNAVSKYRRGVAAVAITLLSSGVGAAVAKVVT